MQLAKSNPFIGAFSIAAIVSFAGCVPSPTMPATDETAASIQQDLEIADLGGVLQVLEISAKQINATKELRQDAIVLVHTKSNVESTFTLQQVYRFPDDANANFRRWKVACNYQVGEDGLGVEEPLVAHFSQKPTASEIAAFKSNALQH